MILSIFAINDHVGGFFGTPFFFINAHLATRALADIVNDLNTEIGRHPRDYSLFFLGTFDNEAGRMNILDIPQQVCTAYSLLPSGRTSEGDS